MAEDAPTAIYIIGPTATGKTNLAIALAQRLNGEIINADSRQVYLHMDIGTAKPTPAERSQAPHHLFDLLPPSEDFSLGEFLSLAKVLVDEVAARGKTPIVVGGTGQYVWALHDGWAVPQAPPNAEFRRELEAEAAAGGSDTLHQRLKALDPQRAAEIDPRNTRRVIRALEIHHLTGAVPSRLHKSSGDGRPGLIIGLTVERTRLYQRIDQRVDRMMEQGFLNEVEGLAASGYQLGKGPLNCPGYRELGLYLAGELSLDEALTRTKYQTHRLVRRQYTWFKLDDARIRWLNGEDPNVAALAMAAIAAAAGNESNAP